jgi:hypothetical protein
MRERLGTSRASESEAEHRCVAQLCPQRFREAAHGAIATLTGAVVPAAP